MSKVDNENFKRIKELFSIYNDKINELTKSGENVMFNDNAYEMLLNIKNIIDQTDDSGVYSSNKDEYNFIAFRVFNGIGRRKLRRNHRYMLDGEYVDPTMDYIAGHSTSEMKYMEEVVLDKEEILEAISYLNKSIEYINKARFFINDNEKFEFNKFNSYHNIAEAYEALHLEGNLEQEYVDSLYKFAKDNDSASCEWLVEYYCQSEVFYFNELWNLYSLMKEIVGLVYKRQKQLGFSNFDTDLNNWKIGNESRIEIGKREHPILSVSKKIIIAFINNGKYDEAKVIMNELQNNYKDYAFWDSRYESEINCDIKEWNKAISVNEKQIVPNDKILKRYFKQETIDLMSDEIKIFVATSVYTYDFLSRINDFTPDYSPSVIPLFKALESLLFVISIEGYCKYMIKNEEKYLSPSIHIDAPDCIYNWKERTFHLPFTFDLGTGLSILCNYHKNKNELYSEIKKPTRIFTAPKIGVVDYLNKVSIKDSIDKVINLCNSIEQCRIYRNLTAHRNKLSKTLATESKAIILETSKIIESIYQDFKPIFINNK